MIRDYNLILSIDREKVGFMIKLMRCHRVKTTVINRRYVWCGSFDLSQPDISFAIHPFFVIWRSTSAERKTMWVWWLGYWKEWREIEIKSGKGVEEGIEVEQGKAREKERVRESEREREGIRRNFSMGCATYMLINSTRSFQRKP